MSTDRESFVEFDPRELDQSLARRFEGQARRHANRPALRIGAESITYDGLNRAANRAAHALLDALGQGVEPVALLLGPGLAQPAAHLSVLKSGKICVPLDPSQPASRLARILDRVEARLILTDRLHRDRAREITRLASRPHREPLDVETLSGALAERDPDVAIPPDSLAYVFHTAGSTGEPKGVAQTHRNLLHVTRIYNNEFRLLPTDRILCPMPLVYAGGVWGLLGTLLNGASFHRAGPDAPSSLAGQLRGGDITIAQLMVSLLRQLVSELGPADRLPSLRLVYTGGEVLHVRDVDRFREILPETCGLLYDLGSTEAGPICHFPVDAAEGAQSYARDLGGKRLVPVGWALDGVEIRVVGDDGEPVSPGNTGQIVVRSEHLSPGYWRDPDHTRSVFRPDPEGGTRRLYLTGDLGAMLPDGCLLHLGRTDLLTKIRGFRVGAGEIEAALRDVPAISDAAVVAREDARGDTRLVAYLACAPERRPSVSELRRRLASTLPAPMVPATFVFLDALPLSSVGKVDRDALPDPGRDRPTLDVPYVAPRTPLETTVADIWADTLGLTRVGVDDDFLDLGGHSLAAAHLALRIGERLAVEIPAESLLQASTVAGQAMALLERLADSLPAARLDRMLGDPSNPFKETA